jgi:hypothetical protein
MHARLALASESSRVSFLFKGTMKPLGTSMGGRARGPPPDRNSRMYFGLPVASCSGYFRDAIILVFHVIRNSFAGSFELSPPTPLLLLLVLSLLLLLLLLEVADRRSTLAPTPRAASLSACSRIRCTVLGEIGCVDQTSTRICLKREMDFEAKGAKKAVASTRSCIQYTATH